MRMRAGDVRYRRIQVVPYTTRNVAGAVIGNGSLFRNVQNDTCPNLVERFGVGVVLGGIDDWLRPNWSREYYSAWISAIAPCAA